MYPCLKLAHKDRLIVIVMTHVIALEAGHLSLLHRLVHEKVRLRVLRELIRGCHDILVSLIRDCHDILVSLIRDRHDILVSLIRLLSGGLDGS